MKIFIIMLVSTQHCPDYPSTTKIFQTCLTREIAERQLAKFEKEAEVYESFYINEYNVLEE